MIIVPDAFPRKKKFEVRGRRVTFTRASVREGRGAKRELQNLGKRLKRQNRSVTHYRVIKRKNVERRGEPPGTAYGLYVRRR